jgi:hypothetical protein
MYAHASEIQGRGVYPPSPLLGRHRLKLNKKENETTRQQDGLCTPIAVKYMPGATTALVG